MTTATFPRGDIKRGEQFLRDVSNTLGWLPHSAKQRRAMLLQVLQRRGEDPRLFSWPNLYLTIELLRRKRQQLGSPLFLFSHVQEAVEAASPIVRIPIEEMLRDAVLLEQERCAPDWAVWVTRLHRASGPGRQAVYDEWLAAGRGT